MKVLHIFTLFILPNFLGNCENHREKRFIRGTYTSTVTELRNATAFVPSSCVYVDATLPPCRNARYNFPNFWTPAAGQQTEQIERSVQVSDAQATPWGWGEYFGIYAPTVTVTERQIRTAVVTDPRMVVTFAVKGCKPLKIPNDLDRCSEETYSTLHIQEILPTSTITAPISATINPHLISPPDNIRLIDLAAAHAHESLRRIKDVKQDLQDNVGGVESSSAIHDEYETFRPTEALPF